MNNTGLSNLYYNDEAAKKIIDWLSQRQKGARVTTVVRAAQVTGEKYNDVVGVFKDLSSMDIGRFLAGRKGMKSRMVWSVDVRKLRDAAMGAAQKLPEVPADAIDDDEGVQVEDSIEVIEHEFQLRPDFVLQLQLPPDLNTREAERLGLWLKSLPFG